MLPAMIETRLNKGAVRVTLPRMPRRTQDHLTDAELKRLLEAEERARKADLEWARTVRELGLAKVARTRYKGRITDSTLGSRVMRIEKRDRLQ